MRNKLKKYLIFFSNTIECHWHKWYLGSSLKRNFSISTCVQPLHSFCFILQVVAQKRFFYCCCFFSFQLGVYYYLIRHSVGRLLLQIALFPFTKNITSFVYLLLITNSFSLEFFFLRLFLPLSFVNS